MMRVFTGLVMIGAALFVILAASRSANSNPPYQYPPQQVIVPGHGVGVDYRLLGQPGGISERDAKRLLELTEANGQKSDRTNELLEQLLLRSGGPTPAQAPTKVEFSTTVEKHCVSCHTPTKADKLGGDFIFFADAEGKVVKPFSLQEKKEIVKRVQNGTMPPLPRPPMSAAERTAIVSKMSVPVTESKR